MSRFIKAEIEDLTSHAVNITFLLDFWEKAGNPKPPKLVRELNRVVDLLETELEDEARNVELVEAGGQEDGAGTESGGSVLSGADRPGAVSPDRETVRRPRP